MTMQKGHSPKGGPSKGTHPEGTAQNGRLQDELFNGESSQEVRARLSEELRAKGFRLTPQREKILDVFFDLPEGEHLSAEELQGMLQRENSDISLATSYRTLKLLVSVGVLRELDFAEDHKHYELARNPEAPHHHIICVECGATREFENQEVLNLALDVAKEYRYLLQDVQLKLFALCEDCQR